MFRRLFWIVAPISIFSVACASGAPDEGSADEASQALGAGTGKVTVCHKGEAITVGSPALAAHLAHGDDLGDCNGDGGDDEPIGGSDEGGGTETPACGADGSSCSAGGDCCSGVCGGSGACVSSCGGAPGAFDGVTCSESNDCCSGAACIAGYCYEGATCALVGTACDDFNGPQCCFGSYCDNGTCK